MHVLSARTLLGLLCLGLTATATAACSDSSNPAPADASIRPDGALDAASDAAPVDGTPADTGTCSSLGTRDPIGETCTGFGTGTPCSPACGNFGYVCFGGSPPGFTGCQLLTDTAFGQTFCCPENKCVAQPDQDSLCQGHTGKPHRFQCPPNGSGSHVTPPASCDDMGAGTIPGERLFCCP